MNRTFIFLLTLAFFSCDNGLSPAGNNVFIYYTGKNHQDIYEFRVANGSSGPVWYWGEGKTFAVYQYAVLNKKGWENAGPLFCGTGLQRIKLDPGSIIKLSIRKPNNNSVWKLGIHIYHSPQDKDGEMLWSREIYF